VKVPGQTPDWEFRIHPENVAGPVTFF